RPLAGLGCLSRLQPQLPSGLAALPYSPLSLPLHAHLRARHLPLPRPRPCGRRLPVGDRRLANRAGPRELMGAPLLRAPAGLPLGRPANKPASATAAAPPEVDCSIDRDIRGRSSTQCTATPPRVACSIGPHMRAKSITRPAARPTRRRTATASLAATFATLLALTGAPPSAAEYKTTTAQPLAA